MRRRIQVCHMRRRIHAYVSNEEEDTCMSYEEGYMRAWGTWRKEMRLSSTCILLLV
jgi:hypothetical protein